MSLFFLLTLSSPPPSLLSSPLLSSLQYNGINLRNATEQQARLIIGQQCDTITIMAQYNPHMHQLGNNSRSRYTSSGSKL